MTRAAQPSALSVPAAPRAARWFLLAGLAVMGAGCNADSPSKAPDMPEGDKSTLRKAEGQGH